MCHIRMNIHGLRKFMDMYGYGCEVTDIHGYPDVTAPISLLQPKGWALSRSEASCGWNRFFFSLVYECGDVGMRCHVM
jgi:hypothetical protein